jgi:hypothetical protein
LSFASTGEQREEKERDVFDIPRDY